MKNFKKITLAGFLSLYFLGGLLFTPLQSKANLVDVNEDFNFTPQIGIPGEDSPFREGEKIKVGEKGVNKEGVDVMRSTLLAKYIKAIYNWGLGIVGVIAVVTLMAAGLLWITSGGKGENITLAKKMISNSLLGMAVFVGAYFLLNTINPNLANMPAIETDLINKVTLGCCEYIDKAKMTSSVECEKNDGTYKLSEINNKSKEESYYFIKNDKCVLPGCCISDQGTDKAICKNRTKEDCVDGNYVTGSCTSLIQGGSCKQGDWCIGAKNGSRCSSVDYSRCYAGICWLSNSGKENEPCGTQDNAFCTKKFSYWNDPNDNSGNDPIACTEPGYKHDTGLTDSGRDCGSGLACCYK